MKLLWQQIIGVVLVLLVALGVSAYLISHYMTQQIYEQKQKQLIQMGINIVENRFTRHDLERATDMLEDEELVIQVYLSDGTVIYPSYDQRNKLKLTEQQMDRITNDNTIGIQRSARYNQNGELINMAFVYISNKGGYSEFPEGFISIGAPVSELEAQVEAVQSNVRLGFVISATIGILMSVIYAMYQSKRIQRLQIATKQIAAGNYELALDVKGNDELSDLARDFQGMANALQQSEIEIKRQETLRRQMMMDAAHEMRTPLTTMNGVLEGLQYDLIPESQKERSLNLVMKETQRLIRLVNENLDYEKIRNQQIVLKYQWIDMAQLLEAIKMQMNEKAAKKQNEIVTKVDSQLMMWADSDRMVQIIMNIVNNAIQFSKNSKIEVTAISQGDKVQITIQDYGIGIDPEKIKNIWERFYKADISRKNTEFGESGIGLAVVKSLVEAHQGTVEVTSELNKGTLFTLTFPNSKTNE